MSAFRTVTATKHIRTLSQPLRLPVVGHPQLRRGHTRTRARAYLADAPRRLGAECDRREYGVPIGAYPVAAPFHPAPGVSTHENQA
ncbi:hypothetical protein EI94DRAFT_1795374 [Lactarius quietus]|nr:hypothetical protein EI94DRAFT_1795374 [Lactarius quietus]